MKIVMAGIDYHKADIAIREQVGLAIRNLQNIYKLIKAKEGIAGIAIISTCNRIEIYISYNQCAEINPVEVFSKALNLPEYLKQYFYRKSGNEAAIYLFELACGIHSLVFGEDQIISQVKEAIKIANEEKASDAKLNTLFRCAVTCAKKVKSQFILREVSISVANQTGEFLAKYLTRNNRTKALVIGNGLVGRKVAEELLTRNCQVFVTMRNHKNQQPTIPNGCHVITYEERKNFLGNVDIVISATSSPHRTITEEMISNCQNKPKYIIDLAVPRDIDPQVADFREVTYLNIDSLGEAARKDNSQELEQMKQLIGKHIEKFKKWASYREKYLDIYCQFKKEQVGDGQIYL